MPYFMTLTEIELSLAPYFISKIVYDMFSNNHAKFHAFITKVNNSSFFWSLAARLYSVCHYHNIQQHSERVLAYLICSFIHGSHIYIKVFCTSAHGICVCFHPVTLLFSFRYKPSHAVVVAKYCIVKPHKFTRAFVVNNAK